MAAHLRHHTSNHLQVGQSVYAVGNPSGLTKTLTAGLVSGLNRTIPAPTVRARGCQCMRFCKCGDAAHCCCLHAAHLQGTRIYGCIQTDASVNAGNSGGHVHATRTGSSNLLHCAHALTTPDALHALPLRRPVAGLVRPPGGALHRELHAQRQREWPSTIACLLAVL